MKKTLVAHRPLTYATRRMMPGDEFTAPRRDADLLVRVGKARYFQPSEEDILSSVREKYQEVVGKRAYHGWDVDELRKRIAEAKDA